MEIAMQRFCFWFNLGNGRVYIPACSECKCDSVVIEATKPGCTILGGLDNIIDCKGICNQYVVFPGKVVDGFRSESLIKLLGKTKKIDYFDLVYWQKSGRNKKGGLVETKEHKKLSTKTKKVKGDGIHKLSDFVIKGGN